MEENDWGQLEQLLARAWDDDRARVGEICTRVAEASARPILERTRENVLRFTPGLDGEERWAGTRLEPGQVVIYGTRTGTIGSNHVDVRGYARCASCGLIYDPSLESCPACHVHSWPNDYTSCTCGEPHPAPIPALRSQRHTYWCPTQANPHNGCACGGVIVIDDKY